MKVDPELAPRLIVLGAISFKMTAPEELAVSMVAFKALPPVKLIPPVPEVKVAVAALRAPIAIIPLATLEAVSVNGDPELAPREMFALDESAIWTAPVELAVS